MNPDTFRKLARSLPEVEESPHFARTSFRVARKIFATMTADGTEAMVRVPDRDRLGTLLREHPDAFFSYGGWTERNGALGVRLGKVSAALLRSLLVDAWRDVAPKRLLAASAPRAAGSGGRGRAGEAAPRGAIVRRAPGRPPRDVDIYLAALPEEQRRALEKLRRAIHAAAPLAEECVSYRLPAFRLDGRVLVAYGAAAGHCALYPMSAATVAAHREDLERYHTSKGTIRFSPSAPLPAALVRKLVKARIAENAARRPRRR